MRNPIVTLLFGASLAFGPLAGCGTSSTPGAADMAAAPPAPDMGCYASPKAYVELLNACTNAQAIDKIPVTPLLHRDGTLPPLP